MKRGIVKTDTGININADTFIYNKLTNILTAEGKVKIEDTTNNYVIYSNKATYQRNDEIVYTEGNSKAIDSENREILAEKITYKKIQIHLKPKAK